MPKKQSSTRNRSTNSRARSKTPTTIFRSSGVYYSQARKCWRMEVEENVVGGSWQTERMGYMQTDSQVEAETIGVFLNAVRSFAEFQQLIVNARKSYGIVFFLT